MVKDSDKDIWNARTIERLSELTTKSSSTESYSITSTPVKRESPNIVNKNIGKKYKASSLPASPNKTNALQRRVLEQPKINTLNSANNIGGSPTKDRKTNNFSKKSNTISSTTLFDFFGRKKESNGSPNIRKGTLKEKLENEAINIITSKYWNSSDPTTTLKLEIVDSNNKSDSNTPCDNDNGKNIFDDDDSQCKDETPYKDEIIQQLRVNPQYIRKLPMNEEVAIDKTDTTRYLHTGDFRACPRQVLHSAIAQPDNPPIDILYLDTTYLNGRYCFPAQEQVVNAIILLIKEAIKNGGLLPLKRTKTIKEQEDKSQMVLDQWFKGKSKEASINPDSDLNQEDSIEILDTNLSTASMNIDETEQKCVGLQDSKILIVVGTYLIGKEK
ncbi:17917_t:CDS:2, partial [Racocetra fulgida]